ncbi:hypothetical protein LCGC14_1835560 [marine sediment metagenome]|uniref:Uncharacterized protein n=1 Tax=marine sediment metagenome TaxID=412755 RepID=A0A0F9IU98_9ZZZZ
MINMLKKPKGKKNDYETTKGFRTDINFEEEYNILT